MSSTFLQVYSRSWRRPSSVVSRSSRSSFILFCRLFTVSVSLLYKLSVASVLLRYSSLISSRKRWHSVFKCFSILVNSSSRYFLSWSSSAIISPTYLETSFFCSLVACSLEIRSVSRPALTSFVRSSISYCSFISSSLRCWRSILNSTVRADSVTCNSLLFLWSNISRWDF